MKSRYTYKDIPDKSKDGMEKELKEGMLRAGIYMYQTMGFPIEIFKDKIDEMENQAEQWEFYLRFRNNYPKAFK